MMMPKEKAKDARGTLLRLWRYLSRQKWALLLSFLLVLGSSLVSLISPLFIGRAIDAIVPGPGAVDFARLRLIIVTMLAVYVVSAASSWLQNFVMVGISQRTVHDLRRDLFDKLQRLPLRFFDSKTHGEVMSRLANDVENVSNTLTSSTTQVFQSLIAVVGSLTAMILLSPLLTILSLITIPIGILISRQIINRTRDMFMTQQRELGNLNGYIEEMVTGHKVVKAFVREPETSAQFNEINQRLRTASIKAQVFSGLIPPLMNVINNLSFALVAGAGGWLAVQGAITVGVIASFLNYSRQFARPINGIANQINMLQSALAGAERVFEIMDEPDEMPDAPDAITPEVKGDVRFDNISFGYVPDVPVLKNVSLHAKPGQTIALVGPTGAGKTTVVNLLMRFYDVDEGAVSIDGHDIRKFKKDYLRRSMGMVLQDTYLFSGTVKENIRYGRLDATDEEIVAAAKMANAHTFIERLPDGYNTVLTSDGGNLSQGQRQLLTIARAILADPSILILDEATSSVDTRTEAEIQKAMLSLMQGRTAFVIAHRLSTIREADEILVINRGEIIERGTHEELLAARGFYYDLYNTQFTRRSRVTA
ncbi:MAG: ABC transporter ATP-binding protein [Firmicutes bacterium]|jgi:ATP-binding cassette subfamily B protein|nr:ABC transporter ATP-binding protein [Bacillota bacterium]